MSELTDKMRTVAAHIYALNENSETALVCADAADLLIEAADLLEPISDPLGAPMSIIEPLPPAAAAKSATEQVGGHYSATWYSGDTLPPPRPGPPTPRAPRVCPQCDSRAEKKVWRNGTELYLRCPACAHAWPYLIKGAT